MELAGYSASILNKNKSYNITVTRFYTQSDCNTKTTVIQLVARCNSEETWRFGSTSPASVGFLLGLPFDTEDDVFFRNIGLSPKYTALAL
jgi:hypothetical protein